MRCGHVVVRRYEHTLGIQFMQAGQEIWILESSVAKLPNSSRGSTAPIEFRPYPLAQVLIDDQQAGHNRGSGGALDLLHPAVPAHRIRDFDRPQVVLNSEYSSPIGQSSDERDLLGGQPPVPNGRRPAESVGVDFYVCDVVGTPDSPAPRPKPSIDLLQLDEGQDSLSSLAADGPPFTRRRLADDAAARRCDRRNLKRPIAVFGAEVLDGRPDVAMLDAPIDQLMYCDGLGDILEAVDPRDRRGPRGLDVAIPGPLTDRVARHTSQEARLACEIPAARLPRLHRSRHCTRSITAPILGAASFCMVMPRARARNERDQVGGLGLRSGRGAAPRRFGLPLAGIS